MSTREPDPIVADSLPQPRRVGFDAPWHWLAAGWRDLWQNASLSLAYGVAVAAAAGLIAYGLAQAESQALFIALAGGFLLIGPLAAVGLYEASRRMAAGDVVRLSDMLVAGFGARGQLLFFGAALMFAYLVWMRLAFLLLALFLGSTVLPPPDQFMRHLLFTPEGLGLLITGTLVGGLIAATVFALSAVAVPLLLARDTDIVTAAGASLAAVRENPKAMALWAVLVAGLMALGFASLLVGLVFVFPLIGHATWHAFADMYPPAEPRPDARAPTV